MDFRDFAFSVLLFVGVFMSGALLYSSMATNYPVATVPAGLLDMQSHTNQTLNEISQKANSSMKTISEFQSGDILGVVTGLLSVPAMLWGVIKLTFVDLPTTMITSINDTATQFGIPSILVIMIFAAIFLFVVFEVIGIIFKR